MIFLAFLTSRYGLEALSSRYLCFYLPIPDLRIYSVICGSFSVWQWLFRWFSAKYVSAILLGFRCRNHKVALNLKRSLCCIFAGESVLIKLETMKTILRMFSLSRFVAEVCVV